MTTTTKRKTRKKKSDDKIYFSNFTEAAIIEYNNTENKSDRDQLYVKHIDPAFTELIDKVVYAYKYNTLPDVDTLKEECKYHLITTLPKFNPSQGTKAFSYFTVICKHWFSFKAKKEAKRRLTEQEITSIYDDDHIDKITTENPYENDRNDFEFWKFLLEEIKTWDNINYLNDNDKIVLESIRTLFNNLDNIDILNKKGIYVYLREISGLETKQITNSLKKFGYKYFEFKKKWNSSYL